jgi:hypothetical protein
MYSFPPEIIWPRKPKFGALGLGYSLKELLKLLLQKIVAVEFFIPKITLDKKKSFIDS